MTEQTSTPLVDFRDFPLEEIVDLLQEIGRNLLTQLLATESGDVNEIWNRLTHQQVNLVVGVADSVRRSRRSLYKGQAWWQRPRALIQRNREFQYTEAVNDRVYQRVSGASFEARIWHQLISRLGLRAGNRFPPLFWSLVTQRAWAEGRFKRDAAELLENTLRQRTLFALNEFPVMLISAETYWMFIIIAASKKKFTRWDTLRPKRRRLRRALKKLSDVGMAQGVQSSGWANVWDQWLLMEARSQWKLTDCPDALVEALQGVLESADEPTGIIQQDWQVTTPRWFTEWMKMKAV